MCQGFAAIVGEPSSVSALGAARRGARIAPSAKPTARDETERGGLEREDGTDLARGEAGRLQQPDLTVLVAGAGADEDPDDDEGNDQEQDGEHRHDHLRALCIPERVVALGLPGLEGERADRQRRCREAAAARSVNAAAADGFASRSASVQRQRARSGSTRSSVAGVTQARPGLRRG